MKHVFALVVLCLSIVTAHAGTPKVDPYQPNWFEQIIQTLTGTESTQTTDVVSHTPRHHHTKYKKHRHSHHAHTSIQRASAGGTTSPAHTKLFEEFQEWHNKQQLYQLFNPIQHGSPQ